MPDPHAETKDPPPELDDALILSAMTGSVTALAAYGILKKGNFPNKAEQTPQGDDLQTSDGLWPHW